MRGRKPRSKDEKLARGETRPSRVNYQEPEVAPPPADELEAPKDLRGAGFRMWRDHAKAMVASGQLRSTDMRVFHEHCKTQMEIEHWEKEMRLRGVQRDEKMRIQRLLNQIKSRSTREASELSMTPVSRSRVKTVTKPPVEKPKHERFFGKGALTVVRGGRK